MPPKSSKSTPSKSTPTAKVSIEHCKSWGVFKGRAGKLENLLKAEGLKVTINEEKPRKGAFVVKVSLGSTIINVVELLDMPRPFTKLKALEMENVAKDVIKTIDAANIL